MDLLARWPALIGSGVHSLMKGVPGDYNLSQSANTFISLCGWESRVENVTTGSCVCHKF